MNILTSVTETGQPESVEIYRVCEGHKKKTQSLNMFSKTCRISQINVNNENRPVNLNCFPHPNTDKTFTKNCVLQLTFFFNILCRIYSPTGQCQLH